MQGLLSTFAFVVVATFVSASSASPTPTRALGFTYLGSDRTKLGKAVSQTDFYLSPDKQAWSEAFLSCKTELGGRLLSIENKAKENEIIGYLAGESIDYVWTAGLYDADSTSWYWQTSLQVLSYFNWKPSVTPSVGPAFRIALFKALSSNWQTLPMSNKHHYICELDPVAEPCFEQKDLVVVLDGSGSIDSADFEEAKTFVTKLARAFTVYEPTRFSFIVYSSGTTVYIPMLNGLTPAQIEETISSATQPRSSTATDLGIMSGLKELADLSRGVPRIMVVLTDGHSNNETATFASADAANQQGVTSFAVGIGSYSDKELYAIAAGDPNRVFETDNFDNLIHLIAPLGHRICETH